jgi:uroporphyrinogen-III synthase
MSALAGRRILVTRAAEDAAGWIAAIERQGGRALLHACVRYEPIDDPATRAQLAAALADSGWLMLTSARGAGAVARLHPAPLPRSLAIAAVGPKTAAAARRRFGRADRVGPGPGAAALGKQLAAELPAGTRLAVAASDRALPELEAALAPRGLRLQRIAVYRTIPITDGPAFDWSAEPVDAVLLASPSAVAGLVARGPVPAGVPVIALGPATARAAAAAGLRATPAARADLTALLEALA